MGIFPSRVTRKNHHLKTRSDLRSPGALQRKSKMVWTSTSASVYLLCYPQCSLIKWASIFKVRMESWALDLTPTARKSQLGGLMQEKYLLFDIGKHNYPSWRVLFLLFTVFCNHQRRSLRRNHAGSSVDIIKLWYCQLDDPWKDDERYGWRYGPRCMRLKGYCSNVARC